MKILYFSVIERHAGWGAEWFLNSAFRSLGHETICVDYREHRHRLAAKVQDCPPVDAVLVQRGDRFPLELVQAAKVPCFFLATELFRRREDQHPLFRCEAFDHVFVRSERCADEIVARGWKRADQVSVLLSSFDPAVHRKLPEVREKEIDLLFLGGLTERRRRILDSLSNDLDVTVTTAFGEEMTRYLNRAKIILNLHAEEDLDVETRVYEVLGCGGFLISERLAAENPFQAGELVEIESTDELEPTIRRYLADEAAREAVAAKGHREALRAHTYRARAEQIVSVMRGHVSADSARPPFARDAPWYRFRVAEGQQRMLASIKRAVRGAARGRPAGSS
jgi:hypothetical protein